MTYSLTQAVINLVYSFEMSDKPTALDEALIGESGSHGPLVSYGDLRNLARAAREHGLLRPDEAALAAAGFAGDAVAAPPEGPQSGAERATPNLPPSPHKEGDSR